MKSTNPLFSFLIIAALAATFTTAQVGPSSTASLAPLSSKDRQYLINELRDRAEGTRLWAEFYEGTTAYDANWKGLADGFERSAHMLEVYAGIPDVTPEEQRKLDEQKIWEVIKN